jgi:hypothetical protein
LLHGPRRRAPWPGGGPTLQVLHFLFELLIAILQLLDRAGEIAQLGFKMIDPRQQIGFRHLGMRSRGPHCERQGEQRSGTDHRF